MWKMQLAHMMKENGMHIRGYVNYPCNQIIGTLHRVHCIPIPPYSSLIDEKAKPLLLIVLLLNLKNNLE